MHKVKPKAFRYLERVQHSLLGNGVETLAATTVVTEPHIMAVK